jgi:hypothetical protein
MFDVVGAAPGTASYSNLTISEARTALVEELFDLGWNANKHAGDRDEHLKIAHSVFADVTERYPLCLRSVPPESRSTEVDAPGGARGLHTDWARR